MNINQFSKSRAWPAAWQLFLRAFILMGLPLLAWGADDLPGFFSNPARTGFLIIVAVQAMLHAWLTYITPPEPHHEHRFDLARWHMYMFETIFIFSAFGDRRNVLAWNENQPLRWLGLGIYVIGAMLAVWVSLTWVNHLRDKGEYAYDDPVLLYDGPFKWIRYPVLLCLFFYCLGFAIAYRSWIGLALMIPLTGGIFNRINNSEKEYAEQYKKAWPLRRHTSKRIIPFLY
jgi:protein-S-isoprenylcysteine O-methyltransferase Ste14